MVPAICRAALAFAEEDYAGCVRLLEPVAAEVVRIGGSGAQREVMEDTLLVALMRSGEVVKGCRSGEGVEKWWRGEERKVGTGTYCWRR